MKTGIALALLASIAAAQELAFEKEPVQHRSIECEVKVPVGWSVAKDRTGLSAQGGKSGFVVTREPFLGSADDFPATWRSQLAEGGIVTDVKPTRAGRYRAFHATWEAKGAPGQRIDVYRLHVPGAEMLYNISFSTPVAMERKALFAGVLKSFKSRAVGSGITLQKTKVPVGEAGDIQLPKGFEPAPEERFQRTIGKRYRKFLTGYETPKLVASMQLASLAHGLRLPGAGARNTSNPEQLAAFMLERFGLANGNWEKKPKTKKAAVRGVKGISMEGVLRGKEGGRRHVFLWCGSARPACPVVLITAGEREMRLDKNYFKTILKSYKPKK
ncbi:MAG: hypothetical protein AAGD14_01060 [Planctomycetota bacterium]